VDVARGGIDIDLQYAHFHAIRTSGASLARPSDVGEGLVASAVSCDEDDYVGFGVSGVSGGRPKVIPDICRVVILGAACLGIHICNVCHGHDDE
jgi:hypothetical protein